jgi:hypothetical protein
MITDGERYLEKLGATAAADRIRRMRKLQDKYDTAADFHRDYAHQLRIGLDGVSCVVADIRRREPNSIGYPTPPAAAVVNAWKKELDEGQRELDDLRSQIGDETEQANKFGVRYKKFKRRVARCNRVLINLRDNGAKPKFLPAVAAEPNKGESLLSAVDRLRKQRDQLMADRREVVAAPIPSAAAKANIARYIDRLATEGRPFVGRVIEGVDLSPYWPGQNLEGFRLETVIALLAWLHGDQIKSALCKMIDEEADDKTALTDPERTNRLAAIDAEILNTERLEEAMVDRALQGDVDIDPREDADVRAILGLADETEGPVKERQLAA